MTIKLSSLSELTLLQADISNNNLLNFDLKNNFSIVNSLMLNNTIYRFSMFSDFSIMNSILTVNANQLYSLYAYYNNYYSLPYSFNNVFVFKFQDDGFNSQNTFYVSNSSITTYSIYYDSIVSSSFVLEKNIGINSKFESIWNNNINFIGSINWVFNGTKLSNSSIEYIFKDNNFINFNFYFDQNPFIDKVQFINNNFEVYPINNQYQKSFYAISGRLRNVEISSNIFNFKNHPNFNGRGEYLIYLYLNESLVTIQKNDFNVAHASTTIWIYFDGHLDNTNINVHYNNFNYSITNQLRYFIYTNMNVNATFNFWSMQSETIINTFFGSPNNNLKIDYIPYCTNSNCLNSYNKENFTIIKNGNQLGGTLDKDFFLTSINGITEFTLIGDIIIPINFTLTIDAGITINLYTEYVIVCQGNLILNGNETDKIKFNLNYQLGTVLPFLTFSQTANNSTVNYVEIRTFKNTAGVLISVGSAVNPFIQNLLIESNNATTFIKGTSIAISFTNTDYNRSYTLDHINIIGYSYCLAFPNTNILFIAINNSVFTNCIVQINSPQIKQTIFINNIFSVDSIFYPWNMININDGDILIEGNSFINTTFGFELHNFQNSANKINLRIKNNTFIMNNQASFLSIFTSYSYYFVNVSIENNTFFYYATQLTPHLLINSPSSPSYPSYYSRSINLNSNIFRYSKMQF